MDCYSNMLNPWSFLRNWTFWINWNTTTSLTISYYSWARPTRPGAVKVKDAELNAKMEESSMAREGPDVSDLSEAADPMTGSGRIVGEKTTSLGNVGDQ